MTPAGRLWLLALAGPAIGFLHLLAIYGLASLGEGPRPLDDGVVRLAMAATSLSGAAADVWLIARARRGALPAVADPADPETSRFWRAMIGLGATLSLATVVYQGLPALMLPLG
jgi:hypothetical protein